MKYFLIALRIIVNILLYILYSLITINIINFFYGLILNKFLDKAVPSANDPIHLQIAIFTLILVTIITIVCRKKMYLSISNKEELKIFIDKEIK